MIDWIVRQIFKWESLRFAIFSEVDLYNSISRTLSDPDAMQIATTIWCDPDGWRGWSIKDNGNYYFHDIPEKSFSKILGIIMNKENENA